MNIWPFVIGGGALLLLNKKKEDEDVFTSGSGTTVTPTGTGAATGQAQILVKRLWINRLLDFVKFQVTFPNGQQIEIKNKLKEGGMTKKFGSYWVHTEVEPYPTGKIKDGQPEIDLTGALNIAVLDDNKKVLAAARVIVPTKNVIDVR